MLKRILISVILLFSVNVIAQGYKNGNDVSYRFLGAKKYLVIYNLYKDCKDTVNKKLTNFTVYNDSISLKIYPKRISIENVTTFCKTAPYNCSDTTPSNYEIVEMHKYTDTIDFGKAPFDTFYKSNVCQVYFAFQDSTTITNIRNLTSKNSIYNMAMLNLCF